MYRTLNIISMEKKVYVVYESSKGRKDVVFISLNESLACSCARNWNNDDDLRSFGFRYTVYEFPLDEVVTFNKYCSDMHHPRIVSL